jgi:hypothetical protein
LRRLVPLRLPPPAIRAFPHEPVAVRLARYRMRCALILGRLWFHVVEGARFFLEWVRWRRLLKRVNS